MKARPQKNWSLIEAAHLLNRAAFGGTPGQLRSLHALGPDAAVEKLLAGEKPAKDPLPPPAWATPEAYRTMIREFMEMRREMGVANRPNRPGPKSETMEAEPETVRRRGEAQMKIQKMLRETSREQGQDLTRWWFQRMVRGPHPAAEKMALFWHGHFASSMEKVRNSYFMFRQNELFRQHALGDFGALAKAIVRDPAMMIYLDLQQSKKAMPNENFARELMELFTLGEGHYTEDDIKQSARAFTGLRLERYTGEVEFSRSQHDGGEKQFHGRKGNFGPDDIVDILLEQSACAEFMARKLWRFYVNDAPTDAEVAEFAATLRAHKYQITPTLRRLFLSEAFYRKENIRAQIKSPVVFLAQLTRQLGLQDLPPPILLGGMREMGQQLLLPPNVAGWPGGAAWINTNTLFARYNMAGVLARSADPDYSIMGMSKGKNNNKVRPNRDGKGGDARRRRDMPQPDYATIAPKELRSDPEKLVDQLVFRFFQFPIRKEDRDGFLEFARKESEGGLDDVKIGHLVHLMLSTPYYQLT